MNELNNIISLYHKPITVLTYKSQKLNVFYLYHDYVYILQFSSKQII
jgi:hypothetical protein